MKKHLTILKRVTALGLLLLLGTSVAYAAYNDVSLTTSTVISIGGLNLSIGANTTATIQSITVNPSSFDVTLQPNSIMSVTSLDRRNFTITNSAGYVANTCSASDNTLAIIAPSSGPVTLTVGLASTTCVYTGPTSSSGGGYSSPSASLPIVVPVQVPAPTTSATSTATTTVIVNVSAPSQPSKPISSYVFSSQKLKRGSRGKDVRTLQSLLAKNAFIYPSGIVNGVFGKATDKAVKLFQLKYNITAKGSGSYGLVGPSTKAKLLELYGN